MRSTASMHKQLRHINIYLRMTLLLLFQALLFMPGMYGVEGFGMMVPWWYRVGGEHFHWVTELTLFASAFFLFIAIMTSYERKGKKE
jgi:hypothetical protein